MRIRLSLRDVSVSPGAHEIGEIQCDALSGEDLNFRPPDFEMEHVDVSTEQVDFFEDNVGILEIHAGDIRCLFIEEHRRWTVQAPLGGDVRILAEENTADER